jgi:Flp pilus assembly protein TadG/uncharacterized Zn-binding protein involved in type VI secretion
MMNIRNRPSEKGQALVLIVLTMVVLLGFTALAVDGGMVYSDRRHAQNAADAASLAGGGAVAQYFEKNHVIYDASNFCSNPAVIAAQNDPTIGAKVKAIARAGNNGYTIDQDISDKNGVTTVCGDSFNGSYTEKYIDVHVMITADTRTSFAQFFFRGPLRSTVEAVARVHPRSTAELGHAVVSLNKTKDCNGNQNGVIFSGNSNVLINGGGIFSNGCLSGNGNSLNVDVTNGNIIYGGELDASHLNTFSPNPDLGTGGSLPDYAKIYGTPDCTKVPNYNSPSNAYRVHASGAIPPGNYSSVNMNGDVHLTAGGLYCLYGDFDAGNNGLNIDESNGYQGVTFYLISVSFITSGGGEVILNAPPTGSNPPTAEEDLLIYLAPGNTGLVKLRGNSYSSYVGTIYAPDGRIDIAGTADMPPGETATFNTQLIANDVEIGGNAYININFEKPKAKTVPTSMLLYK